jgi:hypothetical protein
LNIIITGSRAVSLGLSSKADLSKSGDRNVWCKLLIVTAMLGVQATSAAAFPTEKFAFNSAGKAGILSEKASYCEDTRYLCRQKVGRWSISYSSHWQQCQISYNQCLRR